MQENKEHGISEDMIAPAEQTSMWDTIRYGGTSQQISPFARDPWEEAHRRMLARHKLWLESLQHEYPSPYAHYRIGVYIRFFNQTRYDNYLLFHKQEYIDTIALCPNWTLVDFYVDEGQTAPYMENAREWSRLLQDCLDRKIDLIHKGMLQPFFGQVRCCAGVALLVFVIASPYESAVGIRGMPNLPAIEPAAFTANDSG